MTIHKLETYAMWSVMATENIDVLARGMARHDREKGYAPESTEYVVHQMRNKIKAIQKTEYCH